jgi:hypothetical protein
VRTGGRYPGARGGSGSEQRSWLLIKHRDDWAGDIDITEFAPRSVKSDGDFEDILAEDTPAVWKTNRPAKGGDAGAMLATIIERAARLKAARAASERDSDSASAATKTRKARSTTKRSAAAPSKAGPKRSPKK